MSGGCVPNGIWERDINSRFSLWACLLCTEQDHDERTERTHPNYLTIRIRTTKGDSAELNGKERGVVGGGGGVTPKRLPVGSGGGRGPSDPKPVGERWWCAQRSLGPGEQLELMRERRGPTPIT